MKRTIAFYVFLVLWLIALAIFSAVNLNCMSAPDREDYSNDECFLSADCLYRNKDNKDKSGCSELTKDCVYANKEKRIKARLKHCNENKYPGMTQNECRLYLNQK